MQTQNANADANTKAKAKANHGKGVQEKKVLKGFLRVESSRIEQNRIEHVLVYGKAG